MKRLFVFAFIFLPVLVYADRVSIIPQPEQVILKKGNFILPASLDCYVHGDCENEFQYIKKAFYTEFGIVCRQVEKPGKSMIRLITDNARAAAMGADGYELSVDGKKVVVSAATSAGIFYGIQSLLQLIEKNGQQYIVPCIDINDKPRFAWRSFLLDEARNFKGATVVKRLLDEMAALKMNRFQWHLTDDQGWRIEIKQYPLLTAIGGKRNGTQVQGSDTTDHIPQEGFYSQEQIRELVHYAAERHIEIIPEIEMPGHASAAIAAYPWLGVTGEKIEVPEKFGVFYDVFNVADKKVIDFLKNVVKEVISLFPSGIVHIGGDEVKFDQWKASKQVNAFMRENALQSPADLQIWFTNYMSAFISANGARMMGWNDIMGGKLHDYNDSADTKISAALSPSTIIHFWKGDTELIEQAVKAGHDVVNSYHQFTYLDYSYKSIPLEKAYNFEPVPQGMNITYQDKILGLGCQMWGEWIPTIERMNQQVFPRLAAYAETGWTAASQKDFQRFARSMDHMIRRWAQHGIYIDKSTLSF